MRHRSSFLHRLPLPPTILRFAVDAPNGVLPPITNAVIVAEKMRQAAIKEHSRLTKGPASKRLSGKADDGDGPRLTHDHPFFLPLDLFDRALIDGIDIWLPAGCTSDEFEALTNITEIWDNVVLGGSFAVTYLGQMVPVTATTWHTTTPIILDYFPKHRAPDDPHAPRIHRGPNSRHP